jgi:D-alanyl-D-alanine carboxypeptidase
LLSGENQRHRASGLNLLVAAIILWNTAYLQRAVDHVRNQGHHPASGDLAHLSPLGWKHINLTGDYRWKARELPLSELPVVGDSPCPGQKENVTTAPMRVGFLFSLVFLPLLSSSIGAQTNQIDEQTQAQQLAASPEPFPPATRAAIETAVQDNLAKYGGATPVPGALIGVWVPGKGQFVKGIGYADLAKKKPLSTEDKFRIASNTKTFVVTVILQLVDEKKLSLDDTISQLNSRYHLGVSVPNEQTITLRMLANMTSGLAEYYNTPEMKALNVTPRTQLDPQVLISFAAKHSPLFPPGTEWNYSNTNYLILGLVIEAATNDSVENEIRDRLIVPYLLRNTSFPVNDPKMPFPFSHGYSLDSGGQWIDQTVLWPPSFSWAAGAMISDMGDMKKWVRLYVTGATNSPETQKERLEGVVLPGGATFGLGIVINGPWYGYTGGIDGYNTAAYYRPDADATIIVFVNSERDLPIPGVANAILDDIGKIVFPQEKLDEFTFDKADAPQRTLGTKP